LVPEAVISLFLRVFLAIQCRDCMPRYHLKIYFEKLPFHILTFLAVSFIESLNENKKTTSKRPEISEKKSTIAPSLYELQLHFSFIDI